MSALLGLAGVLIGATITLLTSWQSRSWTRRQWLLDHRLKAFADLLQALTQFQRDVAYSRLANDGDTIHQPKVEAVLAMDEAVAKIHLLAEREATWNVATAVQAQAYVLALIPSSGVSPNANPAKELSRFQDVERELLNSLRAEMSGGIKAVRYRPSWVPGGRE